MHRLKFAIVGIAGTFAVLTAHAQSQSSIDADLERCAQIENREVRLACFDAISSLTGQTPAAAPTTPAAPARAAAPRATSAAPQVTVTEVAASPRPEAAGEASSDSEPREMSRAERRAARQIELQQRELEEARQRAAMLENRDSRIVATVTEFREVEPSQYLVYLDNGQVWRQNRSRRYNLRVGAEVELTPSPWGPSYRLTDPNVGSFIQVERVR